MSAARAALLAVALLGAAAGASAHSRSVSYSTWELAPDGARVVLRVPQLELTRLPFGLVEPPRVPAGLAQYAVRRLRLWSGGVPCRASGPPRALVAPRDRAVLEWRVACEGEGPREIESTLLLDVAPSHLHFARVKGGAGAGAERVLSEAEPRFVLGAASEDASAAGGAAGADAAEGSPLATYLALGVEHIATGYDHLVFLLALLLLASRVSEMVTIVTGFTVAHSLTLGLAALGRVQPEAAAVEALIGLSIALVAAENAWLLAGRPRALPAAVAGLLLLLAGLAAAGQGAVPALTFVGLALFTLCYFALVARAQRPARLRFAVAFCFGLVHGFGFAGVLAEVGLPRERLVPALLGFNVGVELGQLAVVVLVWPVLRWLAGLRGGAWHRTTVEAGTAAVCAMGVFWLVERAYG